MGNSITFVVLGDPVPKGRPRITTRGSFAHAYTPVKTKLYEKKICEQVKQTMLKIGMEIIEAKPIKVDLTINLPIPKSFSKKKQIAAVNKTILPITKPDIDNIQKSVLDALNKVLWKDDSQIVEINTMKFYSKIPSIVLTVS